MKVIGNRVLVSQVAEEKKEGAFETVNVQDNFIYKGRVEQIGQPLDYIGPASGSVSNLRMSHLKEGDIILFAKYSPDTHDVEEGGIKYKFVSFEDILAVI